ncbi:minor structural protein [Loigolactobacillus rennini DSM 20253]|uniref:Minor structural protein n=1 Tax=Loigolactobacillus rennini DSM 20253 TaxID=1423796 RepID=A0A0R2CYD1_9LACO|nr:minor structural protein [Loigolactobacillus rennini DSM 20253]
MSVEASVYWQGQEYIIKQVVSAHSSGVNTIQVTAVHVAYEVSRVRQRQVKTGTLTYSVNDVLAFYLSGNKLGFTWQVIGNFDKQQITDLGNSSGKDMLSKIASTWSDAVFWPDNKNIRIYQHDAIAKNLGNRIDYLHNTSEVKLTYDSTGLVNQVKVYGKQKENTGTDSDKTEYYFTPFLVTDEQSVKQWELHPGDDISDERFTNASTMRAYALAKMTSEPPLTIETSEQRAGEPALMEIRRLEIRPSGFATQVEIVAYKYYPLDKAKPTEVTLNNRAKTILNYKKAGSDALDKALAALKAQRKAILQAAENSQRSYDSRLGGTQVNQSRKSVKAIAAKAVAKSSDLPLYTLHVVADNPDFNLPKGAKFAVTTKAEGVMGLDPYINNWITANNLFVYDQIKQFIGTIKGEPGDPGKDGADGQSAYQLWLAQGNTGTEQDFLQSLVGQPGAPGAKGDPGKQGSKGDKGEPGSPGKAATIAVGTVTTGNADSKAQVTNAGTASAAKFSFVIPKGDRGQAGATGPKGDTGARGPAGKDAASLVIDQGKASNGRAVDNPPSYYQKGYPAKETKEFKQTAALKVPLIKGQTSTFGILTTRVPGTDTTFGRPRQIFEPSQATRPLTYVRIGLSDSKWSSWELLTTW